MIIYNIWRTCFLFQENTPKPENNTKLKSIINNLQRILECPVCFDTLKYPFKWCTNGHGICTKCAETLKACPTCQALFTAENITLPLCVRNVLEALPRFCSNSHAGCEEILEKNDGHEMFCGFRPFLCIIFGCNLILPLCKLISHLEENNLTHSGHDIRIYQTCGVISLGYMEIFSSGTFLKWYVIYFENSWFWIRVHKSRKEECLKINFYSTSVGQPVNDYFLTVKFEKGRFVYSKTLRCYEICTDLTIPLLSSTVYIYSNEGGFDTFVIPFNDLKYLIDKDSGISFKYELFTIPKDKVP